MVLFGQASYATYILHVPLFQWLARFDPALWDRASHVVVYMALLGVASLAAFRFVEEPLRRRLTRGLA
jgi:peptidoglycan/LPS O-acetylase OafA/YrhL